MSHTKKALATYTLHGNDAILATMEVIHRHRRSVGEPRLVHLPKNYTALKEIGGVPVVCDCQLTGPYAQVEP